ncbi:glycoside hydrolase family 16 protein [Cellulomonas wangsupingiae]|uniref:glycoside hydrolase family 16 protein n=1 Tax=Cellulomonas wangsupingiae TaxID=2968085 RepID=UPI001D0F24DF|nr:family 16 glycosylhydrolase [Cellulomonas wangsupingiae]MCM0640496.1 family 16 glycosylhydrolase [Cellulomonas wangsupingiae]
MRHSRKLLAALITPTVLAGLLFAPPATADDTPTDPLPDAPADVAGAVTSLLMDEGFDGDTLDATRWTRGWFGNGTTPTAPVNAGQAQCYDPANATLEGGELRLDLEQRTVTCAGVERRYAGGMITSYGKFTVRPGSYLEARVFLPAGEAGIANEPTVWMQGRSLSWPSNGTVVVMKGEPAGACSAVTRADGATQKRCADLRTDAWHTVGAHWKVDGTVDVYYDGTLRSSFELGTTDPMYPILNVAAWPGRTVAPSRFAVDYVRAWDMVREVTPAAPVREAAACGVEPRISVPDVAGVAYQQERDGNQVTVTASALPGHTLTSGAQTRWTFDVTPLACPPGGGGDDENPLPVAPADVAQQMTTVLLNDNFDGDELDRTVWNRGWVDGVDGELTTPVNVNTEVQCYDPANIALADGTLQLNYTQQATECSRRGETFSYDYAGAMIQSWKKFAVAPGSYVEARLRTQGTGTRIANWPAFWLNGESHNWPHTGEIDVMEGLAGRACASVHGPDINARKCLDVTADAWHTYGAFWRTDGNVDFYYDGAYLATHYLGTTDRQYLILNLAASNAQAPTVPSTLSVDYVRAWDTLAPAPAPDTVRPEATLAAPTAAGPLRAVELHVDATDDRGLARVVANVYRDGALVRSTQTAVDGATSASHRATVDLPDGEYTVRYNAHDTGGNVSRTGTFVFHVDTTPPTVTVKTGDGFTVGTEAGYDKVSFKLHDAGKVARLELNGTVKDVVDDAWSDLNHVVPGAFGAVTGTNTLVVHDVAGNSSTVTFTLR